MSPRGRQCARPMALHEPQNTSGRPVFDAWARPGHQHRLTRCDRAACADIGRSRWAIAARAKAAARGAVTEHSTCEGGSRCQRAQLMIRTDLGSRTALSASRERRGVSLSSPSCSTTSITNSVVACWQPVPWTMRRRQYSARWFAVAKERAAIAPPGGGGLSGVQSERVVGL